MRRRSPWQEVKPDRPKIRFYYWVSHIFGFTFGIKLMERGEEAAQRNYGQITAVIPEAAAFPHEEEIHEAKQGHQSAQQERHTRLEGYPGSSLGRDWVGRPQINIHARAIVVRLSGRSDSRRQPAPPIAPINLEVLEAGREERDFDGCLIFPEEVSSRGIGSTY